MNNNYLWTDGENTYYSTSSEHLVFNKEKLAWEPKEWNNIYYSFTGEGVWSDGENIYYDHYQILNKETSTWEDLPTSYWNISFEGINVISINNNIYYIYDGDYYILNKESKIWNYLGKTNSSDGYSIDRVSARGIVKKDESTALYTYYSYYGNDMNERYRLYKFNEEDFVWEYVGNHTYTDIPGTKLYNFDDEYLMHYKGDLIYIYDKEHFIYDMNENIWKVLDFKFNNSEEMGYFSGRNTWSDGENTYLSYYGGQHFILKTRDIPSGDERMIINQQILKDIGDAVRYITDEDKKYTIDEIVHILDLQPEQFERILYRWTGVESSRYYDPEDDYYADWGDLWGGYGNYYAEDGPDYGFYMGIPDAFLQFFGTDSYLIVQWGDHDWMDWYGYTGSSEPSQSTIFPLKDFKFENISEEDKEQNHLSIDKQFYPYECPAKVGDKPKTYWGSYTLSCEFDALGSPTGAMLSWDNWAGGASDTSMDGQAIFSIISKEKVL